MSNNSVSVIGNLEVKDFPFGSYQKNLKALQKILVEHTLEKFNGNQTEAAEYLGVGRRTFKKYITLNGVDYKKYSKKQ